MTSSLTRSATSTFTITDARYIASKLGADLRNLNAMYGKPALVDIPDYVEEVAQLLKAGYLKSVDFGFKSGTEWKLRLRYTATANGYLDDNNPGQLPRSAPVANLPFYSFLTYSAALDLLPSNARVEFLDALPVHRVTGTEPTTGGGSYGVTKSYARAEHGLERGVYTAAS
ncbi:HORMA-1 domain-containing protein [Jatrophihabitans sp. YIM 134969]